MKKKIFSIFFLIILLFSLPTKPAKAQWTDLVAMGQRAVDFVVKLPGIIAQVGQYAYTLSRDISTAITSQALVIQKVLALLAVQQATSLLIGDGNGGGGTIIRDFNDYLYVSPQQRAMAQMNSFFNTVSRGRLSTLNYEGIGPNYDAYLVAQARMAIAGQPFTTNLQDLVTDPKQMFDGGNMKGLMTYMQCANNVACYTMTSTAQYNLEFAKAQEIARTENVNGFIPKKVNGRITQPASIAQNALTQLDQLGTQIIMNAKGGSTMGENTSAINQVWLGAGISATARLTNYGISDEQGKEAIRNKNDQFPFSIGYSSNGGLGINAGGVSVSTGVAAFSGSFQAGNTCSTVGIVLDSNGNAMTYANGQKKTCVPSTSSTIKPPTATITTPVVTTPQN
ncbi:MAG: hypothetical protein US25_C0081G0002 [Candidatus Moranbacteria bacterium GW2011_GWE1_36_7]|nr:MAG: hypothetical protein UR99_C0049G0002 [Candidatus Moranbacteria bacterium GW2011_GWD2_36_12]KKQ05195.1 MAG: hypothetical protein US16_C0037G0002 [Candidatus Moranbacteria bacterium GW2011_GWE2_36_40]KKQ11549.1 MAG: hypothetical protein US25_C0081G0002 [Candidatus Moranbacteria bacterium GW2011_GWE1_36_7]